MTSIQDRARQVLAQGATGTNSKRPTAYVSGVYPTHFIKAQGCHVWGENGRKYIDFVSGLGSVLLGHNHPKVTDYVMKAVRDGGPSYSLPHPLEVEVAEKIQERVKCAEKIRFLKTGNEATLAAVRIARAHYESEYPKDSLVHSVWNEGYHGHGDLWTSLTPPSLGVVEDFSIQNIALSLAHKGRVFITEPVMTDASDERHSLLKQYVSLQSGGVIFDEVITGFRVPEYCVANWWGMKPDLICMGKAIANGYPLSFVAGKKEVMGCGEYFISSTFSGETMSLAACNAVLDTVTKENLKDLYFYANRFMNKFNEVCAPIGTKIVGYGTRGQTDFYENPQTVLLFQELCKAGLFFGRAFFFNFAHLEAGIDEYVFNIVSDAVAKVSSGKVKLEGEPPQASFKR